MDLAAPSSDSDKWVSPSEADAPAAACARNIGTVSSTSPCQSPGLPMKLPCSPVDSECRLSLEGLCRERDQKKHKLKQSKLHPVKSFSGKSVLLQEKGRPFRKISRFGSREIASDDPSQPKRKQVSKHEASPRACRTSSEVASSMPKSVPALCLTAKVSSGRSRQRDSARKRKHSDMSVDAGCANQSEVSGLNDPAFRSSSKCKNRSNFVKNILLKSTHGGVLQLMEAGARSRHDSTSEE
ncbi:hypothetical protein N310_13888, partial [Acanthisitta chloris]